MSNKIQQTIKITLNEDESSGGRVLLTADITADTVEMTKGYRPLTVEEFRTDFNALLMQIKTAQKILSQNNA